MFTKGRFSALKLIVTWLFLAIPFFLVLLDWSSSRQRELQRLEEKNELNALSLLEKMQVDCSWELQSFQRLNMLQRHLRQMLAQGKNEDFLFDEKFTKNLKENLPPHHLLIAINNGSGNSLKVKFKNSTLPGSNLLDSFSCLMDDETRSKQQLDKVAEDLLAMVEFPVNVKKILERQKHIHDKDEGMMLPFNSLANSRWLYWFYPSHQGKRVLVAAVFDVKHIDSDFAYQAVADAVDPEDSGIAVIPLKSKGRVFWSGFLEKKQRLRNFIGRLAPGLPLIQSRHEFGDYYIYAVPMLVGESAMLVMVKKKITGIPLMPSETVFLLAVLLTFLGLSIMLFQRQVFRRGWRISIGLVLFLAIVSVFYMPAGIGRLVVKYSIDSYLTAMHKSAEIDLERNLQRLEDRYNLSMSDFYYRLHHLEDYPQVAKLVSSKKPQKALNFIEENVRAKYPKKRMKNSLIFLSLQQDSGENMVWLRQSKETKSMNEMFAPLLAGSLQKFRPDLIKTGAGSNSNLSLKDVKEEMIADFLIQFFQGILGQQMYYRLMADPRSLIRADSTFIMISTTGVPIKVGNMVKAVLLAIWSEFNESEEYLDFLVENRSELAENFDFVAMRKGRFQSWNRNTTAVTPKIYDLSEKTRRVGIQLTSREMLQSDDRLLMKSRPGKTLGLYILVGITSLKEVFASQLKLEKGFDQLVVIGFFLMLILVLFLYRYFIRPLRNLQASLDEIVKGEYQARMAVDRNDEFGNIGKSFNAMARGLEEGSLLGRFVSSAVIKVVKDKEAFSRALKGEKREMTIMFVSVEIPDESDQDAMLKMLALHLQACQESIKNGAGVIDKVIENKILVFFDHDTCGSATEAIRQSLESLNRLGVKLAEAGAGFYSGIATGPVVAGILGAKNIRLDYTVIGDAVNLAARLNAIAHDDKGSRVITDQKTVVLLPPGFESQDLGQIDIKGKTAPVKIFRVLS